MKQLILLLAWLGPLLGVVAPARAQTKVPAPTGPAPVAAPRYQPGKLSTDPATGS